jgi:hypothetical protein
LKDYLPVVAGIGQRFDITAHPGGKDKFPYFAFNAFRTEGGPFIDIAVG